MIGRTFYVEKQLKAFIICQIADEQLYIARPIAHINNEIDLKEINITENFTIKGLHV
jgi:hypothetical protein